MKGAWLGAKYFVSDLKRAQTVVPSFAGSSRSRQSNADHGARPFPATPRFSRYQPLSALGSFALRKPPPTPLPRSIALSSDLSDAAMSPLTNPTPRTDANTKNRTAASLPRVPSP